MPRSTSVSPPPSKYKNQRKHKFEARASRLDPETLMREKSEFRGFFVFFWIMVAIFMLQQMLANYRREGTPFRLVLLPIMSRDLLVFALSDFAMVGFTLTSLVLHKAVIRLHLPLWVGLIVKHLLQSVLVLGAVGWTMKRNWPWPQTGTLCLHACAMFMKMHSYMTTNAEFEGFRRALETLKKEAALKQKASPVTDSSSDALASPTRLTRRSAKSSDGLMSPRSPVDDTDELIKEMTKELTKGSTTYPHNVTLGNFIDYLLVPTLVYELDYPRTEKTRWGYIVEKIMAFIGAASVLYYVIAHHIYPGIDQLNELPVLEALLQLVIPFSIGWLIIFFIIFECVCNVFAEFTRFADRQFYDDWWNSSSYDEFSRKWNKPVHEFLLRHVYLEAIDAYKLSRNNATFITYASSLYFKSIVRFLFSALLHELVVASVARKFSPFFFFIQMTQLPLIWIARMPIVKRHPLFGNIFFWLALNVGQPILMILYCYDWARRHEDVKLSARTV